MAFSWWKVALSLKRCDCFGFLCSGQLCVTFVFVEAIVSSGKNEKSPHDQEIKFFAKVSDPVHLTITFSLAATQIRVQVAQIQQRYSKLQ